MTGRLLYCDINNFGDALNKVLFEKMLGMEIHHSTAQDAHFVGIGSIMESILQERGGTATQERLLIYSAGFGFDTGGFFHNKNILLPEEFVRPVECYALRGERTKQRIEKITGQRLDNVVLGDGGLLASELIKARKVKKKYSLGIVPHFADKLHPAIQATHDAFAGSRILDVQKDPLSFLRDLAECEAVISTAMHPLIACDALRIPNLWVRVSEKTTSRYKFHDYYSAFGVKKSPVNMARMKDFSSLLATTHDAYNIKDGDVFEIQGRLYRAMGQLKSDLKQIKINPWSRLRMAFNAGRA